MKVLYKCETCGKTSKDKEEMEMHERIPVHGLELPLGAVYRGKTSAGDLILTPSRKYWKDVIPIGIVSGGEIGSDHFRQMYFLNYLVHKERDIVTLSSSGARWWNFDNFENSYGELNKREFDLIVLKFNIPLKKLETKRTSYSDELGKMSTLDCLREDSGIDNLVIGKMPDN